MAGFQLAGVSGLRADNSEEALNQVNRLIDRKDLGMILLSDDVSRPIRRELTEIRTKKPVPMIYEVPSLGSKKERIEYRDMLKQILGV